MKAFAIAKRIPLSYRHRMVAVTYHTRQGAPRCKSGRCPLGWLFVSKDNLAPSEVEVGRRLRQFARNKGVQLHVLADEAGEFIGAFDNGELKGKKLRVALGLRS